MTGRRVAVVTGGGQGIGRAIALALARAGIDVAVLSRSRAPLDRVAAEVAASGHRGIAVACNVTLRAELDAAFARVRETLGPVDILVNNAGIAESAALSKLDEDLWDRTLAVNLKGTYLCTRAAIGGMIARGAGRIISVASVAGRIGFAYTSAYCAAKHGVLGFTRAVALEVARNGITVNAICPGWVDTDMTTATIARIEQMTGRSPEEARRALEGMSPQHRLIQPDEVAAVAVFLVGDAAAAITGQAIDVDGGAVMA